MIDYEKIVSVLQRRYDVDRNESGVSRAITETEFNFDNSLGSLDDDDHAMRELFIAQPEPEQSNTSFVLDIIKHVPQQYKIGVAVVVMALLKADRQRKPLTIEMTRQYLKRAKVPNTTDQAKHVFTFLTTLRRQ